MINLVWGQDALVADFVHQRITPSEAFVPGTYRALGFADEGGLVAGVVYHNVPAWGSVCEIALASDSPRWCSKGAFAAILSLPFSDKRCLNLVLRIEATNKRSRKLVEGVGFKPRGTVHHAFGYNRHMVIYELTRKQWSKGKFHVKA